MAIETEKKQPRNGSSGPRAEVPLHRRISDALLGEIQSGIYRPGDRLPSEAVLCERFDASRITVAKALGTLQRDGLVRRRAGSGTYVQQPTAASGVSMRFGLLIPDLGATEIFEPICRGMMSSPLARTHSLVWGHAKAGTEQRTAAAEELCRQFIEQRVTGVFFAPLEYARDRDQANRRIVSELERARVAIVLLDRCTEPFPLRSKYDLVGIDNHRAGALMTRHLLEMGSKRPVFMAREGSAATVYERGAGYMTALRAAETGYNGVTVCGNVDSPDFVAGILDREKPDALQCANDHTAANVMRALLGMGVRVPDEVRVTGMDDVRYAQFLPVPLTTIHQNCEEMGRTAMAAMLDRVENAGRTARELLTDFEIVVRESCGAPAGWRSLG